MGEGGEGEVGGEGHWESTQREFPKGEGGGHVKERERREKDVR